MGPLRSLPLANVWSQENNIDEIRLRLTEEGENQRHAHRDQASSHHPGSSYWTCCSQSYDIDFNFYFDKLCMDIIQYGEWRQTHKLWELY